MKKTNLTPLCIVILLISSFEAISGEIFKENEYTPKIQYKPKVVYPNQINFPPEQSQQQHIPLGRIVVVTNPSEITLAVPGSIPNGNQGGVSVSKTQNNGIVFGVAALGVLLIGIKLFKNKATLSGQTVSGQENPSYSTKVDQYIEKNFMKKTGVEKYLSRLADTAEQTKTGVTKYIAKQNRL